MKVCFSSQGDNLDSEIDSRFGRCKYFVVADTKTKKFSSIQNPHISSRGGAGIQSGQLVAEQKVKVVLTGNIGPNAFHTLQEAKVDVVTGVTGTIRDALEKYIKGELTPSQGPSTDAKFGIQK